MLNRERSHEQLFSGVFKWYVWHNVSFDQITADLREGGDSKLI